MTLSTAPTSHVAVAHAGAQQAAARGLEHREVDGGIAQHHLRGPSGRSCRRRRCARRRCRRRRWCQADGCGRPSCGCARACGASVVLPLVPVTAAIGMRDGVPGGNSMSMTGAGDVARLALGRRDVHAEAGRGVDLADAAADLAVRACVMSGVMKSMPATSRPIACAARIAISRLSGWTTSVRSIAVPPVERLPVDAQEELPRRRAGTVSAVMPLLLHAGGWPGDRARGGSAPSRGRCRGAGRCSRCSTSCGDRVRSPSPTTWPGTRLATATSSPPTTSMRWS